MLTPCKFCDIAEHRAPSVIVFEDELFMAFLDARPLFLGHTLLIPKQHYPTFYDIPGNLAEPLVLVAQKLGKAIQKAMDAEGSFIATNNIVSQSVPHMHIHLVPRNKGDGLKGFFWPRTTYASADEMLEVQAKIKRQFK